MGQEMEWKLAVPNGDMLERILADPALRALAAEPVRRYHMQTAYYDTPDRRLGDSHITLRRRLENEISVICVKAPLPNAADPHLHGEWETEGTDLQAALPLLAAMGAPRQLPQLAQELVCLCRADFVRRAVLLELPDGSACELACDCGSLFGPTETEPLCELELELKRGAPAQTAALCGQIAQRYGLLPQPLSKYARAKALG